MEAPARLQDPVVLVHPYQPAKLEHFHPPLARTPCQYEEPDNPPLLASIDPLHEAHTCGVVGSSEVGIGVSSRDDGLLRG